MPLARTLSISFVPLAVLLACGAALAQQERFKLMASDGASEDRFGHSVALAGSRAVIGAYFDDDLGPNSGSAYVFDIVTAQELFKFTASDGTPNDWFGWAVAGSDDRAVVTARDDQHGVGSGSAYVFDLVSGQELLKLTAPDAAFGDEFGVSVAISADFAVIGARWDDDLGPNSGSAYIFNVTTGQMLHKLVASDGGVDQWFGGSVAISGTRAIVGARDEGLGASAGSAYVFDVSTGQELFKLVPSDLSAGDLFGSSVAIGRDRAVIGAMADDDLGQDSGSAYVFDVNSGQELFKLTASDGAPDDLFGRSVAISGVLVIVGAVFDDDLGANSGSGYVFNITTGQELAKLLPSDGSAGDWFGLSVAASGNWALLGAEGSDDLGYQAGSAYVFDMAFPDCNGNGIPDSDDIGAGTSQDCDADWIPDECQIADNPSLDLNGNGFLDECECFVSRYCIVNPNSTNVPGRIGAIGLPSISLNSFTLSASDLPPGQFGIFFFGPLQIDPFPFGDGYRCVGGQLTRLDPPIPATGQGIAQLRLDFTRPPLDWFVSGDTTNFQFWYRDPQGVGVGFNLTDALQVTFCP